jgi:hypothetical protein
VAAPSPSAPPGGGASLFAFSSGTTAASSGSLALPAGAATVFSGWVAKGAVLSAAPTGIVGPTALRVSLRRAATTVSITLGHSLPTWGTGRKYRISGWLRSNVPGSTVCLRTQEIARHGQRGKIVRTTEDCSTAARRWHRVHAGAATVGRGHRLRFSVYEFDGQPGDSFDLDGFRVSRG